jgi:hypothetical protein
MRLPEKPLHLAMHLEFSSVIRSELFAAHFKIKVGVLSPSSRMDSMV